MAKKTGAFFLLVIYLLPVTPVTELLKLPQLAGHYLDHRAKDAGSNFADFLFQHYCEEDGTDKDAAEDSQLPFKSSEQILETAFVSFCPPEHFFICPLILPAIEKKYHNGNDAHLPAAYAGKVWQPPRSC